MEFIPKFVEITKPYLQDLVSHFKTDDKFCLTKGDQTIFLRFNDIDQVIEKEKENWDVSIVDSDGNTIYDAHIDESSNEFFNHYLPCKSVFEEPLPVRIRRRIEKKRELEYKIKRNTTN